MLVLVCWGLGFAFCWGFASWYGVGDLVLVC